MDQILNEKLCKLNKVDRTERHAFEYIYLKNYKINIKQINNRIIIIYYKDIVLVSRLRIFCTTLFTNNIKVVIQMHAFLFHKKLTLRFSTAAIDLKLF